MQPDEKDPIKEPVKDYSASDKLYGFLYNDEEAISSTNSIGNKSDITNKYLLKEQLGKGGSGEVYRAFDPSLKRNVAIKLLETASPKERIRFLTEAEVIASLKHPNIVSVHEVGKHSGKDAIVMNLVEGSSLDLLINALGTDKMVDIMIKVCSAIGFAHSKGIVHLDLKPHNIMVEKGSTGVYVTDFGLAKDTQELVTITEEIVGTPNYMPPEQIEKGGVDARSDVYSIGATLYHCLTKSPPFARNSSYEILRSVVDSTLTLPRSINKNIPAQLEKIVMKCMSEVPTDRYSNATELKEDLERFRKGESVKAAPAGLYRIKTKLRRKSVLVLLLLAIIALVFVVMNRGRDSSRDKTAAMSHFTKGNELLAIIKNAKDMESRSQFHELSEKATEEFSMALEIDPELAEAYLGRGEAHYRVDNLAAAVSDFETASELNPNLSEAHYRRIITRMTILTFSQSLSEERPATHVRKMEEALEKLKRLQTLPAKTKCAKALLALAKFNTPGYGEAAEIGTGEAITMLSDAIKEAPSLADPYLFLAWLSAGNAYKKRDQVKQKRLRNNAIENLHNYIRVEPNILRPYKQLADLYILLEEYDSAIKTLDEAALMSPGNPVIMASKGLCYAKKQDPDTAQRILNNITDNEGRVGQITSPGEKVGFYINRGHLRIILGKHEEAEKDFSKALELTPELSKNKISRVIKGIKK